MTQIAACQRCGGTISVQSPGHADLWLRIHDCAVFRQHEETRAALAAERALAAVLAAALGHIEQGRTDVGSREIAWRALADYRAARGTGS